MSEIVFYFGIVLLLSSLFFWNKDKTDSAFLCFLLAISCFGFHSIARFDFLFWWDERFHALVAKNTIENPLKPSLYKEAVLNIDYSIWYKANIWLHKQPAFTWQMAFCMWVFGDSLIAMRLSSVAMLLLLVCSIYFGSKKINPQIAFPLAVLVGIEPTLYNLISGQQGMDHNDMAFIAWVAFSYFGLLKLLTDPDVRSGLVILVIGVSMAVLTKWLAGFLVFGSWGLYLLHKGDWNLRSWRNLGLALLLVFILISPWQVYTFLEFKDLAIKEWAYNGEHLFTVVENHSGPWNYHFDIWKNTLPVISIALLFSLFVYLTFQFNNSLAFSLLGGVIAIFILFSLAKTKLPNYSFLAIGPAVLAIAAIFKDVRHNAKLIRLLYFALILTSVGFFINRYADGYEDPFYEQLQQEKAFYSQLANDLPENALLLNTPPFRYIQIMYYTDRIAYDFIPDEAQLQQAIAKGYVPVFLSYEEHPVPKSLSDVYKTIPINAFNPPQ